jgi:hypothetical protein
MRLLRPTRAAGREHPCDLSRAETPWTITATPIRSCSRWGLPCRPCCQGCGALLPHRFALARGIISLARIDLARAVCFLWHFPWGRPRRRLAGTVFPWSPDFPLPADRSARSGRPAVWQRQVCPARPVQSSTPPAVQALARPRSQSSGTADDTPAKDAIPMVENAGLARRGQRRFVQLHDCALGRGADHSVPRLVAGAELDHAT